MSTERLARILLLLWLGILPGACNTLVRREPTQYDATAGTGEHQKKIVEPLSTLELLRHSLENLGEVEPGLLYRSDEPSRALLEFLRERVDLRYVLRLRGDPEEDQRKAAADLGLEIIPVRMSAKRPIRPGEVLEIIRLTRRARSNGGSILVHCAAGADRTGMMVALWRMLFQDERDVDKLLRETVFFRHLPASYPNVHRAIELARPELFRPFVENEALLDDEAAIAELESRYVAGYPLLSGSSSVEEGPLRAGAGRVDLLEGWTKPIQMATYGPNPGLATEVRDPVDARALLLDNGARRIAIVACDLLITTTPLRDAVEQAARERGLRLSDLVLGATHTHTSVGAFVDHAGFEFYMIGEYDQELFDHLVERIVTAISKADRALVDAKLGAGAVDVHGLQKNRRLGDTVDPRAGIVKVETTSDEPIATLVNFAAHPILAPGNGSISADYPGALARRLDAEHGMGLFLSGALGDLNARAPSRPQAWREEGLADEVADILFRAVKSEVEAIGTRRDIELGSLTSWVDLPGSNVSIVPDVLFPLELLLDALMGWPSRVPLQSVRLGDAALVATPSELGCRLGLEIKARHPARVPLVVTHANGYAGYALRRENHAKRKIDASSLVALNGPGHGPAVVEHALEIAREQWDASDTPAGEQTEFEDENPTLPQARRPTASIADSHPARFRAQLLGSYLDNVRGGTRADGLVRDVTASATGYLPGDWRVELETGYRRADWRAGGARGREDGPRDLLFGVERPFDIWTDRREGNGLRLIPRLDVSAPTADANRNAPFAFAAGAGVWRPGLGTSVEFTWDTYRAISVDTIYRTAIDDHQGRRPGDVLSGALRYTERHGCASFHLATLVELRQKDSRAEGRTAADVSETSFSVGLAPGVSFRLDESLELFFEGQAPLATSGDGARAGHGVTAGLLFEL